MPDETVETYTNIYARWFAIISQFIVTASLCTLWRLQMTRYSQVLVHSTVVNSRLSHQYMSISPFLWGFLAEFGCCFGDFCSFSYFFSAFLAWFGCCFGDFCSFSYFFLAFSGFTAGFLELFWGFLQFQLLFAGSFPALRLGFWSCFGDFCSFSYFLPGLFRLYGWVLGAVLVISAVSATFSRLFSGFWAGFGVLFWGFLQFQLPFVRLLA